MITEETVSISLGNGETTSGILNLPTELPQNAEAFIIAHGQGNGMTHPLLDIFAKDLAAAGYITLRFNFLYREKGRETADKKETLYLAWQSAVRFMEQESGLNPGRIFLAGKSLGAKIAALMASEGLLKPAGLIFLGYPLHPIDQMENIQAEHFAKIAAPMLFFAGTRDPFCSLAAIKTIFSSMNLNASSRLEIVDGGDHSFEVPKAFYLPTKEIYKHMVKKTLQWRSKTFPKGKESN
ncbi:MAG: dienelactone hydrolase family protein [Syntrophobacterales bacterium]|jgi:predicted alpha/beta-hydrolase family hydrolase|nr:dienelactone hydrolase family protein [Syntrophobacterales bacterium]